MVSNPCGLDSAIEAVRASTHHVMPLDVTPGMHDGMPRLGPAPGIPRSISGRDAEVGRDHLLPCGRCCGDGQDAHGRPGLKRRPHRPRRRSIPPIVSMVAQQ